MSQKLSNRNSIQMLAEYSLSTQLKIVQVALERTVYEMIETAGEEQQIESIELSLGNMFAFHGGGEQNLQPAVIEVKTKLQ